MHRTPQAADALAGLHDIVTPETVSYGPQTVGWYIVLAALLTVAGWLAVRAWRRARAERYRRLALGELAAIEAAAGDPARRSEALSALPALLKRAALARVPRERVASLSGDAWLAFLERTGPGAFTATASTRLAALSYARPDQPVSDDECAALVTGARHWIRLHRAADAPQAGRGGAA